MPGTTIPSRRRVRTARGHARSPFIARPHRRGPCERHVPRLHFKYAFTTPTHSTAALGLRLSRFPAGVDHVLPNVPLEDLRHQAVERATGRRDGLEQCDAVTVAFQVYQDSEPRMTAFMRAVRTATLYQADS